MSTFALHTLAQPSTMPLEIKVNDNPAFLSCAGCETRNAVIVGAIATADKQEITASDIGLLRANNGLFLHAVYCANCWPTVVDKYQK